MAKIRTPHQQQAARLVMDLKSKYGAGWALVSRQVQEDIAEAQILSIFCNRSYEGSVKTAKDLVDDMNAWRLAVQEALFPDDVE